VGVGERGGEGGGEGRGYTQHNTHPHPTPHPLLSHPTWPQIPMLMENNGKAVAAGKQKIAILLSH
jgi:hypothetical protein